MTLNEFIDKYDLPGSVVLLEGKRDVKDRDMEKLEKIGSLLTEKTKHILFRSGNAKGADLYFSKGVAYIDKTRLQAIAPYGTHRKKENLAYSTISLDDVSLIGESKVVYQSKMNKKTEKLIDRYVSGERDRFSMKAAYIIRDTVKVLGTKDVKPASFGIFYDDLDEPMSGGTGHTMNVCKKNNVGYINQRTWFAWLNE